MPIEVDPVDRTCNVCGGTVHISDVTSDRVEIRCNTCEFTEQVEPKDVSNGDDYWAAGIIEKHYNGK